MKNQRYTEAFRDGMRAAGSRLSREAANACATMMPVADGDAYLAGFYAEIRKLNADAESRAMQNEDSDPAADRGDWQFHMGHDQ